MSFHLKPLRQQETVRRVAVCACVRISRVFDVTAFVNV